MNQLLYLYGIIPRQEEGDAFSDLQGIDEKTTLSVLNFTNCAAVLCMVPEAEYGEEVLQEKTNQIEWVQEKAFHHHEILLKLRERTTVIPMKFGTIFHSEASLAKMIHSREIQWETLLEELEDKEEWNIKIYCDRSLLRDKVVESNVTIKNKKADIAEMSQGMQYLQRKKLDQLIDQELEREQYAFSEQLHEQWTGYAAQDAVKKVWNKDVTGKEEEMCSNSAYLIPLVEVESFLEKVTRDKDEHEANGWKFEVTGPWPAYHFVNLSKSEV